jgi:hypothetical protein
MSGESDCAGRHIGGLGVGSDVVYAMCAVAARPMPEVPQARWRLRPPITDGIEP